MADHNSAARVDLDALIEAREVIATTTADRVTWEDGTEYINVEDAARILADRLAPLLAECDEARAEVAALRERIDHWCAEWSVSFPGLAEHLRAALADPEAS